ncbi:MAG TPA: retropepsin-like aspartic protease [Candidatus Nitrosocosmicus sp.]|nr:retropepsin-like aspartic protease [Candidatus Nitrosocosmicus sp.]
MSQSSKCFDLGTKEPILVDACVNNYVQTICMIDCGATSQFIDYDFAKTNKIPLQQKKIPEKLTLVDGRPSTAGDLIYEATIELAINQYLEKITFQITKIGKYPMILGTTWLERHNPQIDWRRSTVSFTDDYCLRNCLSKKPTISTESQVITRKPNIAMVNASAFRSLA